ncbi:tautomerase family protein [Pseudomonas fluorescens]|uniref:Tautomerase family protein n=1 Tax=Pseudomonas fluorescens TaxID=294 RepID=A0A1T2Z9C8_PSEFL|nr:tautomerase family protein [Pseudomonas fluorescens]OPB00909.1 tautomerase family protein [Pseudomonas fluorescens]
MPLIKIDIIEGRSETEIRALLDTTHRAMVDAFQVPERDRYQILSEHRENRMIVEDTGLGIARTNKVVVISVTSRPRTEADKVKFYQLLAQSLEENCGIKPTDLIVSIATNTDSDWSFGHGRAQFLTGEL